MLKEGPVAILDIIERLPDGILKDIQARRAGFSECSSGQVFRKSENVSVTNIISAVVTKSLIQK